MDRLTEHVGRYIHIKGCKTLYDETERKGAYLCNAIVRLCAFEDGAELQTEGALEKYRKMTNEET